MSTHSVLLGIVTMNRKAKLERTLSECQRRGFRNIVVVDNGSTDGTREFLSDLPHIQTIFSERNEGGSGGFNRVMRHFIEKTDLNWLMLFDDDAFPLFERDKLLNFLRVEASDPAPGYAFTVIYPDGTLCAMNRPGENVLSKNPFFAKTLIHHINEATGPTAVDFASFVGVVLSRTTVESVGYVSREFFIYSDDTYYTLTVSSALGKLRYCPQFRFIHDCKRSSTKMSYHDSFRLKKDVVNKLVLIREFSSYWALYSILYLARLGMRNPKRILEIASAGISGFTADLRLYRNEPANSRRLEAAHPEHGAPA